MSFKHYVLQITGSVGVSPILQPITGRGLTDESMQQDAVEQASRTVLAIKESKEYWRFDLWEGELGMPNGSTHLGHISVTSSTHFKPTEKK